MKKTLLLLSIITLSVVTSGCNQYFRADMENGNGDIYYGTFNRRDYTQADVKLFKRNSTMTCDGIMFLDNSTRMVNWSNKRGLAKMVLGCSDGTVIDADWQMRKADYNKGIGKGVDQFNNIYTFKAVPKSEFKKNVKQKYDFVDDNTTDNYLKY